jgi:hypothetical protein
MNMQNQTLRQRAEVYLWTDDKQTIHPCVIQHDGSLHVFDGTPNGRSVPNPKYDERAEHLTEQQLTKGEGTPNSFFDVNKIQGAGTRAAGAGSSGH